MATVLVLDDEEAFRSLLITDLYMPDMDGIEQTQRLQQLSDRPRRGW
ncbi:MAG: hypothetical protein HY560_11020 [Gemmatimonadetes bacterium]|nr:hypothetical protein [Gemmatimonadota bacterium]